MHKTDHLWTVTFVCIVSCALFCFLVGQACNAGSTIYLENTNSTLYLAGIGALCFSVGAAFTRVVVGPVIDLKGRMIVVVIGSIVMLMGCIFPLLINAGFYFVLWRVFQGIGFSATTTALSTAAADVLPESRLGEGISYFGLGQAVAMSIGPALGIALASSDTPQFLYIVVSIFAIIALTISVVVRYEKNPTVLPESCTYKKRYNKNSLGATNVKEVEDTEINQLGGGLLARIFDGVFEPGAIPASVVTFFIASAFGFGIFYVGSYGNSLGIDNPGIFFTFAAAVSIFVRLVFGKKMNTISPNKMFAIGVAGGVLCFSLLLICNLCYLSSLKHIVFYLSGIFYGLCIGLAIPVNQTMAVKMSPDVRWGAANGLFMLSLDVSCGLFSIIWGFVSAELGFAPTLVANIVLIVLSFFAAQYFYKSNKTYSHLD